MSQRGVILYGPPAAGKDSTDRALRERSADYVHFARIKVGSGNDDAYRMVTKGVLNELRLRRDVIWENRRYGAIYAVDRPGLVEALDGGIPVIHLGQPEGVDAVVTAFPEVGWTVVELWCPADVAELRLGERGDSDLVQRMRMEVWHETPRLDSADLRVDTALVFPEFVASMIDTKVRA
jgi:guanylate kinase